MKKALFILFIFILLPLLYTSWPIYQGMAFRGMLPMIGFNYITWPTEQPTSNKVLDIRFKEVANQAIELLSLQQQKIAAPGYTAAVALDGKLIWAGSVGWADITNKIAMTTDTQLRIGSTSKALTATGLARLVDRGQLNLDQPLSDYFDVIPNRHWANITARQLASHSAGIPHYGDNTETFGILETLSAQTHFKDPLEAITIFDESDMLFEPGEQFSYSSFGTVLLSALMQIKAKVTYQTYMQQAVFKPLAMNSTFTETPHKTSNKLATFYWQDKNQPQRLKVWYDVDLSHRLAGGGWVSTSKDLVKLGQGFMNNDFISAETRATFWTPQKINNGEINPQKYGIGWRIHQLDLCDGYQPLSFIHHGGVSAGAQSFLMIIPEYQLSISVNANIRTEVFSDFASVSYELTKLFIDAIEKQKTIDTFIP
ncbi:serine hydrolase domain-containing protein [Thalassotalea castellviae]|uniref:Serine hydrolase domain-containing protein n=1 Tax=Thalassotalea castellviae TaxID=3075612 RepID=A0ABU3A3I4_9GAMM|nr:serine hydrolase domain-containing protein [Thalassotalea sp. W431]MDT0604735.1 serine hydrolase domain-containing protein [Thalassotalea sp. W431]